MSLALEPGAMVYENEIAEALGVSRTPVREAIRLLVSEGLLDVLPQRGTRIALISGRKVREARFVREQLELGAFREAARRWPRADRAATRARIAELLERQRAAAGSRDIEAFLPLDEAFHRELIQVADNDTLLQIVDHMRAHLNRVRALALRQFDYMDRVVAEHEALLESIERGDEEQTAARLVRHLGKLDEELPALRERYPHLFVND
ncbi:GntR family transcriptional regulator [Paenibacillus sp. TRM 82003]|nr:GntR family transcriptional regulator [Paenibacillus sp. TRM 82003]